KVLPHRGTQRAWPEEDTTRKTPQQRRKAPGSPSMEEKVLDEQFLERSTCCHHLGLECSDLGFFFIFQAREEDFEKFACVAFINASENLLPLGPFQKFPGLRELELSLNGLRNLKITSGDFLHLEDLDLSYNHLSPQDVWTLGDLSQLKVLLLMGNGLQSLPPALGGSWGSAPLRFPSLEVLALDENHLADPSVFVSLSQLCRLRELNLDSNRISAVPYLQQAGDRKFFLHPALHGDSFRAARYKSLRSFWKQLQPPQQQEDKEVTAELEAKQGELEAGVLQENRDPSRMGEQIESQRREVEPSPLKTLQASSTCKDGRAPFPELKHLSLAFNKITEEASLLPVAFFPCLEELIFHNNPLVTTHRGRPPLLTQLLQHHLGIKLVRQKNVAMKRCHFSIPLKASHKVISHLPKATKWPLMVEPPAKTFLKAGRDAAAPSPAQPLPPMTTTSSQLGEGDPRPPPGPVEEDTASFFMTQIPGERAALNSSFGGFEVEEVPRPPLRPPAEDRLEKGSEETGGRSSQEVPERYKELLGGDPDLIRPVGMQKNIQALSYLLKHPLLYWDARPRLDTLQKPSVPQRKCGRTLNPPAHKTRAEVLDEILVAMRNTSTITEVPLASVLQQKSSPRGHQEAQRLVKEFQKVFE
ncbi:XRRA1 protein, partial [Brachypteracias leptosomus]|nr:XRRA1 protein [Brachypteracias leptosomus]